MSPAPPIDRAKRRRRTLTAASIMMVVIAFAAVNAMLPRETPRAVDIVRTAGLIGLALVLALRSTTNFTLMRRDPELDDELTRANRASAALAGFWSAMLATAAAFVGAFFTPITVVEAAPLILAAGVVAASARFVFLEAKGEGVV